MHIRYLPGAILMLAIIVSTTPVAAQDECAASACAEVANTAGASLLTYPATDVQPLSPDAQLLTDGGIYNRVSRVVDVFDAPDGRAIGLLDNEFAFVTTLRRQEGWTEINPNQWVQSQFLENVPVSPFAGVMLTHELPYRLAWILEDARPVAEPGAEPADLDPVITRYTRVVLREAVDVRGSLWYQVGPDRWLPDFQLASLSPVERPAQVDTYRWISVDLDEQIAVAYAGNTPVFATLVSTGTAQRQTHEGLFHIYAHYKRVTLDGAAGIPDWYYLEDVPWMMYFDENIGFHGAYWHDRFGYPSSHGCVNLSITDAAWLYRWSQEDVDWTAERDLGIAVFVFHGRQS
jgi:hypothetical protein